MFVQRDVPTRTLAALWGCLWQVLMHPAVCAEAKSSVGLSFVQVLETQTETPDGVVDIGVRSARHVLACMCSVGVRVWLAVWVRV